MDRKTALTAAGAIVLTIAAGTSAMAVNLGILDDGSSDRVGDLQISPSSSTGAPSASEITDLPPSTTALVVTVPTTTAPAVTTPTTPVAPSVTIDDHGGDDHSGDDDSSGPGSGSDDDHSDDDDSSGRGRGRGRGGDDDD